MKIGIDVTSAIMQGGGIGRYTRELVQAILAQDSDNEYVLFSAPPPSGKSLSQIFPTKPQITYKIAPVSEQWLYRIWYRARLPVSIQRLTGKLDLFHSPDFVLPPTGGAVPTLLTVHDLSFVHYPEVYPEVLVNYLNKVVPWSVGRATHILADSAATKQDLMAIWQVPDEKITVLYSGVSESFVKVEDEGRITAVRHKYNLGQAPYLLSVGTVQPRKNYQMLIQAFAPLANKFPHNLYIAGGKGWLYDDMMAEIERQGLIDRVRFIGFVDDEDLPTLYSAADLYLFPSLYEGFGLPMLEAMACGVPVIASDVSSLPEVGEGTAVLLPPHALSEWTQTMQAVLSSPQQQEQMISAGYQNVQRFSWKNSSDQLLKIYQVLLS
ncbi:MAG: glycosyltransferase family 4 protein [Anaerolineae bacterium]|nr:glycosyltransferase family 4 protein [Anaerolineae bacterium]